MNPVSVDTDVLVIGHGAAGTVAATMLASRGKKVILAGRGATATSMSSGCLRFQREDQNFISLLDFLLPRLEAQGLLLGVGRGRSLLTRLGTEVTASAAPLHTWAAQVNERTALLGITGHPDLEPELACAVLETRGKRARPLWASMGEMRTGAGPGDLAQELGWEELCDRLSSTVSQIDADRVGLPPLFPLRDQVKALTRLERRSGRQIFEPVVPLSLPGQRLQEALEGMAVAEGCILWKDRELIGVEVEGPQFIAAHLRSGMREVRVEASCLVLASGNIVAGGHAVNGRQLSDRWGAFQITVGSRGSEANIVNEVLQRGLRTEGGRLVSTGGVRTTNAYSAGAALPGVSLPGTGLGEAMLSGWDVARLMEAVQ
jgi:anaerobic glycerol-3-phosphate dehydrogenase